MEAPSSRRSQGTRVGHTNSFRRRLTRLDQSRSSASTQRHLTSATEHERALTRRELALRAVANVGADRHLPEPQRQRHHARVPPQRARPTVPPALGASWSPPRVTSRTRLRHRRSDEPCGRSLIASTASGSADGWATLFGGQTRHRAGVVNHAVDPPQTEFGPRSFLIAVLMETPDAIFVQLCRF